MKIRKSPICVDVANSWAAGSPTSTRAARAYWRRTTVLAAAAAIVAGNMGGPNSARAGITLLNAPGTNFSFETSTGSATDSTTTQTIPFTVAAGANCLVLNYGEFYQTAGDQAYGTQLNITWTPTGGTATPLLLAGQQISSAQTYVLDDVMYLYNPTPGAGTLTVSANTRTLSVGAFTLSGVNTAAAPIFTGHDSTTTTSAVTLNSSAPANSFADVSESFRTSSSTISYTSLSTTSGTLTQQYNLVDPGGFTDLGGTTVTGVSGTPTFSATLTTGSNRSEIAAAVFSPIVNGPYTWNGTAGSGGNATWDTTSPNWVVTGTSTPTVDYIDASAVTFDNTGTNPNIAITSGGVNPTTITFSNSAGGLIYTLGGSGSGAIGGTASLTVAGGGMVNLNSNNTYSGGTFVTNGILNANSDTALGTGQVSVSAANTINFTSASPAISSLTGAGNVILGQTFGGVQLSNTLTFNGSVAANFSGVITDGTVVNSIPAEIGSVAIAGTGLVQTLSAPTGNTYTGGTTVGPGTLLVTNTSGSGTGSGPVAVNSGGVLGGSGIIGGAVTLSSTGVGTLQTSVSSGAPTTLTINNTLTLNAGSIYNYGIKSATSSDLVKATNLTLNGALTLNLENLGTLATGTYELFGFTGTLNNSATWNVTSVPAGDTPTVQTPASGAPAGEIVLNLVSSPAIKWTGAAGSSGAGNWDTVTANWSTPTTGLFYNNAVTFDNSGSFPGVSTTVTVAAGGVSPASITFNNGTNSTGSPTPYIIGSGVISGTGTTLTLAATAGAVTLTGQNTFTGAVTINGGSLLLTPPATTTATTLTGAGTGAIALNAGVLSIGGSTAASVAVTVNNNITLAGGTMGVSEGAGNTSLGGTITVSANTTTTIDDFDPLNSSPTYVPNGGNDLILTGSLAGSGNLIVASFPGDPRDGNGFRLRDATTSTFSGTITVQPAVKFELQTSAATGSPMGTGTLIVQSGTYTNLTTGGTFPILNIRNTLTTSSAALNNPVQVTGSGMVFFNLLAGAANQSDTFGRLTAGGTGATQAITDGATTGAVQTLAFTSASMTGGTVTFQPGLPGNTNYLLFDKISVGAITEAGGSPGTSIALNGTGTLTFTAANSYAGSTTVNGGTLFLGAPGALPSTTALAVNGVPAVNATATATAGGFTAATVDLNNGAASNDQTVASLTGSTNTFLGTITNSDTVNAHTLTVAQTTATTYSGLITGNLNLNMNGAGGSLTLPGAETYTGTTQVTAGTLNITGSVSSALGVTVASNATLSVTGSLPNAASVMVGGTLRGSGSGPMGSTGTVGGTVTIQAGGKLAPGSTAVPSGPLTLTGNSLVFASSTSVFAVTLPATPSIPNGGSTDDGYSSLFLGSSLNLNNATLTVDDSAYSSSAAMGDEFFIIDETTISFITGSFNNGNSVRGMSGITYAITYANGTGSSDPEGNGFDVALTVSALAPEPASLGLLGVCAAGLLARRRRFSPRLA